MRDTIFMWLTNGTKSTILKSQHEGWNFKFRIFETETANKIVTNTVKGAAELLVKRNKHPESEIDKVTTPKGCTIAGLNEMEHNGFSSALIKGIVTSYKEI